MGLPPTDMWEKVMGTPSTEVREKVMNDETMFGPSMEAAMLKLRSAVGTMAGVTEGERELLHTFLTGELGERQRRREAKTPPLSTLFPSRR